MVDKFIKSFHVNSASLILLVLLCTDFAFFAIHSINKLSPNLDNSMFFVDRDESYPELFQYIKWFWIIILLVSLSIKSRSFNYMSWGLVFTYILLDDALQIHEQLGNRIALFIDFVPPFGLRPQDIAELVVTGTAGIILFPLIVWAYKCGSRAFKKMSRDMLILIFALFFFGVVIDTLHSAMHSGNTINALMAFIEDSGEMVIGSIICWYVFLLSVRGKNHTSNLSDFIPAFIKRNRTRLLKR